ncbi:MULTISPECIES: ribonuclease HII [unclassified Caulobacter]|uniref:ribonuclease HII n=1 Tax=unclassified Caulobacter TaxID=2648921 RepID=UPI000D398A53|nr:MULTISPECIES: ribonuclease HII [unclassified Caulobacter]PTS87088.1 ribonuclease HII [Caulobacter sp. HMWF009]PTT10538.1 ribonuclease HII [Caulobacter sp. HMWF025]
MRTGPDMSLELACGHSPVCGVDEAGRGPWAGPVSAGAVILDPDRIPKGLNDSKKLTARARAALELEIQEAAIAWGVGLAGVEEIDGSNILKATGLAMRRAVEALAVTPAFALVDGNYRFDLPCPLQTVVKGDALSCSIAAASILAKEARDRIMVEMDAVHPGYGFAGHKGYHAAVHVAALQRLGPSPIHRMSWAPIKALLGEA